MEDRVGPFSMEPGDVLLFSHNQTYGSPRPPAPYRAMNILFKPLDGDVCLRSWPEDTKAEEASLTLRARIPTGDDPAIRDRFATVVQLFHSHHPLRHRRAGVLLEDLLFELATRSDPARLRHNAPVEYAIDFLTRHLDGAMRIDELADLVGMSRRSLTRQFRVATGRSIQAYHLEKRIALAQSIFQTHPDITLAEVAATLGFYDAFHFSKTFRRHTGMPPAAYRQACRGAADESETAEIIRRRRRGP